MLSTLLALLLFQQSYAQSDYVQVAGASLAARFASAQQQGSRGADETYWVAYRLPLRPGIRVNNFDTGGLNISISSTTNSDGFEWIPDPSDVQRVGVFMMARKSDGKIDKARLINLTQNFRVHDRKVYWIGEPNGNESVELLNRLVTESPQNISPTLMHYMSLNDSPTVTDRLIALARSSTATTELKRNAISYLGQQANRQAGAELLRMTEDPNVEIERQAVVALSRRPDDESIPALIKIAKEHKEVAIRKQAITQLGQKRDARVIDFFEQVLKKK